MMAVVRVHRVQPSGPVIVDGQSAVDLIGEVWARTPIYW